MLPQLTSSQILQGWLCSLGISICMYLSLHRMHLATIPSLKLLDPNDIATLASLWMWGLHRWLSLAFRESVWNPRTVRIKSGNDPGFLSGSLTCPDTSQDSECQKRTISYLWNAVSFPCLEKSTERNGQTNQKSGCFMVMSIYSIESNVYNSDYKWAWVLFILDRFIAFLVHNIQLFPESSDWPNRN